MSQRSTIRDVAREASVSVTTVSRYLNGTGYVNDVTRKRIEAAVVAVGYEPNMVARGLKTGHGDFVVLAVPDIGNPFYANMARTVQALAERGGYAMILIDSGESRERERAAAALAQRMCASGMLLSTVNTCSHLAPMMQKSRIPIVGMSAWECDPAFDVVTVNESGGTDLAVSHLAQLGHRRIAFVGGTKSSGIARGRRAGYLRQMAAEGLTASPDLILETGFSQEDGYRAGMQLMQRDVRPTSICCANDLLAFGVMQALGDMNVRVPSDVSVTGMDDIPYAPVSQPRLTTVSNDSTFFASEAFSMLLERMRDKYQGSPRRREMRHELVLRESTCPPGAV